MKGFLTTLNIIMWYLIIKFAFRLNELGTQESIIFLVPVVISYGMGLLYGYVIKGEQ